MRRTDLLLLTCAATLCLAGCNNLPTVGPNRRDVIEVTAQPGTQAVQIVDVDDTVARRLLSLRRGQSFSETLGRTLPAEPRIGAGDGVEVSIWESPPAALFGGGVPDVPGAIGTARPTVLPEQMVDRNGDITVPFAGRIHAVGLSPEALEQAIARHLEGRANHPQALVRVLHNNSANVTVVGEVNTSVRMPLTAHGERLLDALAAAGGTRQPINKTTVQITRGDKYYSMPLEQVIRDPRQNIPLQPGDVVMALFEPLSFTALGSTGKNDEITFEAQGINLAQALARSGGLIDSRSDPQGVFVFRFEQPDTLDWPRKPVVTTPDGLVPVVYRIDLKNPNSFFVMQSFPMSDRDVLYVSNAPVAELQKFLNVLFTVAYPILNVHQLTK